MNRDRLIGRHGILNGTELITQLAFHEAGHAAAIYIRNRYHSLPPVNFHISLSGVKGQHATKNRPLPLANQVLQAKLENGLLINNPAFSEGGVSVQAMSAYRQACEGDVINLLAGPLAEAKHIAQRDGEYFNHHLVNFEALKNYGGASDQRKVEEYIESFGLSPLRKAEKLRELHTASYQFINQAHHWCAITRLAEHILGSEKDAIVCEEAVAVLEAAL